MGWHTTLNEKEPLRRIKILETHSFETEKATSVAIAGEMTSGYKVGLGLCSVQGLSPTERRDIAHQLAVNHLVDQFGGSVGIYSPGSMFWLPRRQEDA